MMRIGNRLKEWGHRFELANRLDDPQQLLVLFLRMTLLIFIFHIKDTDPLIIFMPVVIIPGLLITRVTINKFYWVLLSCITIYYYLILDLTNYVPNHRHIFAYLAIGITLGLFLMEGKAVLIFLRKQARYIIGLCFLFAAIGKFLAPEFLNGGFFEFTNTVDPRFFGFTSNTVGISMENLMVNYGHFQEMLHTIDPTQAYQLYSNGKLETLGLMLSYWTIFIESMVAISFCIPQRFKLSKYRDLFLVAFILTTYPIATVVGFALVLAAMGFVQSLREGRMTPFSWFYLLVYIAVPLNYIPFARLFSLFG